MAGEKWSARLLRTRAQVQTLIAGAGLNYPGFFQISNAVGSTKQIHVWSTSSSTISSIALDLTTGKIGTYDITTDVFTSLVDKVISITYANLRTLVNASNAVVGQLYLITNATFSTSGFNVPLIVMCAAGDKIGSWAIDTTYNTDQVLYDFDNNVIMSRWDILNNIKTMSDWRNGIDVTIGTGCSNISVGLYAAGNIPDNSVNVTAGNGCSVTLDATSQLLNVVIEDEAIIDDGGNTVSLEQVIVGQGATLQVQDAACSSIIATQMGQGSRLNTVHNIQYGNIGAGALLTTYDNAITSSAFGIFAGAIIDVGAINNAQILYSTTLSAPSIDVSNGLLAENFSSFVVDYDIDNIASNTIDLLVGGTDDISFAGTINLISGSGAKTVTTIINSNFPHPTRFRKESGFNVTFDPTPLASVVTGNFTSDSGSNIVLASREDEIVIAPATTGAAVNYWIKQHSTIQV